LSASYHCYLTAMPTDTTVDHSNGGQNEKDRPDKKLETKALPVPTKCREILKTSTVFVAGLAPRVGRIHLEKLFQKYGSIERLEVKITATSKCCFCEFQSVEEAQKAMDNLDGRMLLNRRLIVKPAQERGEKSRHPTLLKDKGVATSSKDLRKQQQDLEKKIQKLKQKIKGSKHEGKSG
jgi:RNA recognition motif-containing protein